ncbi:MAG: glutathione S-transferase family protein [Rhizobiaceae bacterium]|nr:glutathione S-transferase family protein [Rhizobiaceae bacterium]
MYKLIGSPKTRAFRVLWMLEELGLEYEIVDAGPRTDDILAFNPSGKVPALVADDNVIIDSSAIVQFLADRHEKFTYPAGTIERAKQDSFLHFANDDLDGTCWVAAKHSFVLPEELRVSDIIKSCQWDWGRAMMTLEQRLGNNEYVMGETFTVPDIIICHVAGWAKRSGFDWPSGRISDYFERAQSRLAFQRAWEIRGNS